MNQTSRWLIRTLPTIVIYGILYMFWWFSKEIIFRALGYGQEFQSKYAIYTLIADNLENPGIQRFHTILNVLDMYVIILSIALGLYIVLVIKDWIFRGLHKQPGNLMRECMCGNVSDGEGDYIIKPLDYVYQLMCESKLPLGFKVMYGILIAYLWIFGCSNQDYMSLASIELQCELYNRRLIREYRTGSKEEEAP